MTDRELLELAAKAADIPMKPDFAEKYDYYMADPLMWNPLTDDGDALRLAVKLGMYLNIYVCEQLNQTNVGVGSHYLISESHDTDPCAATRKAIVCAAAEVGKAML